MRQSMVAAILGTILLGAAAGQAHAQYRDRDYGYGGGNGYPGGNGRGDYAVNRVMRDVERVSRGAGGGGWGGVFGGNGDQRHVQGAMNELQNFDSRWRSGNWDQRRLDKAIEHVSALANSRSLNGRDRQMMYNDANMLREFRSSRGAYGNNGRYGNSPYGYPPYSR